MRFERIAVCLTVVLSLGFILGLYKIHDSPLVLRIFSRSLNDTPPHPFRFPQNYHATGKLHLPHSQIEEPFEVWFSRKHNRSRIDYYYGTDKTFQLADLGKHGEIFKVVPMYNDKKGNYIGCWNLAGSKQVPIVVQPIVPNMTTLKFSQYEVYRGTATAKWEYRYLSYGLLNTHTLWVTRTDPPRPVRYEMKGYDNLLASYYDYYILEYISFEEWKPDLKKFELPKDLWCNKLAHSMDSHLLGNPMQEFLSYGAAISEKSIDKMYVEYKTQHNKSYDSDEEHLKRKHIFRHNMRYIRSINRKNLTYKLAPNHMVDMMDNEYDHHEGLKPDTSTHHKGAVHLKPHHESYSNMTKILKRVDVPDELDWREYGAVTPVRGQGICGSCYAIAAVGALEGAHFMKTGKLVELSAQQVIDCSWGSGNHGCRGGYYNKALSWIYLHGIATADSYGPYLAQEGTCHFEDTKLGATLDAFAFVPKHNSTALKISVAKYGPAAVSMNESPMSLKFYSWGIYDDPACDNRVSQHSALVIGYGQENGIPYWLVKNTWSKSWGMDGYIKIAWKDNTCGITRNPVVALMKHSSFQFPVKEKITHVNPSDPDSMGRKIHPVKRPWVNHNKKKEASHYRVHKITEVNQDDSDREITTNTNKKSNIKAPCAQRSRFSKEYNLENNPAFTKHPASHRKAAQSSRKHLPCPGQKGTGQQMDSDVSNRILQRTRPYLGQLQSIYERLEKLISSSKN